MNDAPINLKMAYAAQAVLKRPRAEKSVDRLFRGAELKFWMIVRGCQFKSPNNARAELEKVAQAIFRRRRARNETYRDTRQSKTLVYKNKSILDILPGFPRFVGLSRRRQKGRGFD